MKKENYSMEDKKALNSEDLEKVNGGAGNITISYIHMGCGGTVVLEDVGTHFEDIYLTCQKCGRTWHPHSSDNLNHLKNCDDVMFITTGSY